MPARKFSGLLTCARTVNSNGYFASRLKRWLLSRMQINSHRRAISRCGCAAKLEETLSDQITWRWKLPWPWTKRTSWKRSKHWHLAGSFNAKRSVFHLRKKGGWLTRSELGPLKGSYGEIVPVPRVKAGSPSLHDGSRCRSWYCTKDYSGVWRAVLASSLKSEQGHAEMTCCLGRTCRKQDLDIYSRTRIVISCICPNK